MTCLIQLWIKQILAKVDETEKDRRLKLQARAVTMQVRNVEPANLATSASDIQSKIDIVYSSVRDSARGRAHTNGAPSPHIKPIGQELQLGKRRSARRENTCPRFSRRLTAP